MTPFEQGNEAMGIAALGCEGVPLANEDIDLVMFFEDRDFEGEVGVGVLLNDDSPFSAVKGQDGFDERVGELDVIAS